MLISHVVCQIQQGDEAIYISDKLFMTTAVGFLCATYKSSNKKPAIVMASAGKKNNKCKPILKYITFSRSRHSSQVLEMKVPNAQALGCFMLVTEKMKVQMLAVWDFWFL